MWPHHHQMFMILLQKKAFRFYRMNTITQIFFNSYSSIEDCLSSYSNKSYQLSNRYTESASWILLMGYSIFLELILNWPIVYKSLLQIYDNYSYHIIRWTNISKKLKDDNFMTSDGESNVFKIRSSNGPSSLRQTV